MKSGGWLAMILQIGQRKQPTSRPTFGIFSTATENFARNKFLKLGNKVRYGLRRRGSPPKLQASNGAMGLLRAYAEISSGATKHARVMLADKLRGKGGIILNSFQPRSVAISLLNIMNRNRHATDEIRRWLRRSTAGPPQPAPLRLPFISSSAVR